MMMATQKRNNKDLSLLKYEGEEEMIRTLDPKRLKSTIREKKDKFGEKVAALQQLVTPFGKTDTASVLQETTGYIKFLHEQLEVLSAPYLQAPPQQSWLELDRSSLRGRGLCLVPVASSLQLAQSNNGADIWAPVNTVKR
ncbi:basic helix-loop-helix (bHLH) DNA-binding superfamily [Zostera marina]|uniref:Basic helix-loop-helix (BHLH) DNA-binding superfamily n=1 Tax=Zostera marina TaxID=29655 RepID=A0A0K9Q263_ZOSMR|nr:basic helix-loop-helix (bHLH) DNA-binding superfamily [Zostera marina]